MDRPPYRASQQAGRPVARPATQPRSEASQTGTPAARPTAATHHAVKEKKSKKIAWLPYLIGGIVVVLAVAGWFVWSPMQNAISGLDTNKYQAIFLTNGQVYFGKLQPSGSYLRLTDVFYLQTQNGTDDKKDTKDPQAVSADTSAQLIKLGNEIHGPEDEMIVSRDQVLIIENLKADGKVAKTIAEYKNSKQ